MDRQELSRLTAIDFGPDIGRLTEGFVGREWVMTDTRHSPRDRACRGLHRCCDRVVVTRGVGRPPASGPTVDGIDGYR